MQKTTNNQNQNADKSLNVFSYRTLAKQRAQTSNPQLPIALHPNHYLLPDNKKIQKKQRSISHLII